MFGELVEGHVKVNQSMEACSASSASCLTRVRELIEHAPPHQTFGLFQSLHPPLFRNAID